MIKYCNTGKICSGFFSLGYNGFSAKIFYTFKFCGATVAAKTMKLKHNGKNEECSQSQQKPLQKVLILWLEYWYRKREWSMDDHRWLLLSRYIQCNVFPRPSILWSVAKWGRPSTELNKHTS
jgi:hypothetical protein